MTKLPDSIIVINLDRATDRWTRVQQSHAAHLGDHMALERLPATDTKMVEARRTPGTLSSPEKGCLLSHLNAFDILATRGPGPFWIAEDDIAFGQQTVHRLGLLLERLKSASWDILFTDVTIATPRDMLEFWVRRDRLRGENDVDAVDLSGTAFGGTTSYLVNAGALPKLRRMTANMGPLNVAWDVWLRAMAKQRRLTCLTALPFLTRVSHSPSQIQTNQAVFEWWAAYRDLMFCDPDLSSIAGRIDAIESPPPEAALFGRILGGVSHGGLLVSTNPAQERREASAARASNIPSLGSASNIDSTA